MGFKLKKYASELWKIVYYLLKHLKICVLFLDHLKNYVLFLEHLRKILRLAKAVIQLTITLVIRDQATP